MIVVRFDYLPDSQEFDSVSIYQANSLTYAPTHLGVWNFGEFTRQWKTLLQNLVDEDPADDGVMMINPSEAMRRTIDAFQQTAKAFKFQVVMTTCDFIAQLQWISTAGGES